LRTLNADAQWRNISVEPSTRNDYRELEQHAALVQHPIIVDGPPWWTPWHIGMLFTGVLALALLIQLAYFRFKNWKTNTITRERERLAHEIHDTMAQGFAGVGYQIQGIRSSIVRGERLDSRNIADQLSVAYQLVRSCHEEASRTIAMLGLASPPIKNNLLGELAETTRKTAGNKIKTTAEIHGNPIALNLWLADALLHIGREAIANALSHGDPTLLKITLSYEDDSVELAVEDNGGGFEYSQETAGFGILGMQKRARSVGSTLHISSTPGRGTQVRVKANLQNMRVRNRILMILKRRFKSIPANTN
jgi:signal transduction histidine kinase